MLFVISLIAFLASSAPVADAPSARNLDDTITVLLSWPGELDLDLQATGLDADGSRFRVYHQNESEPGCRLRGDYVPGVGIEVLRIYGQVHGPYQVYVHDYIHRESDHSYSLSRSGARVDIFYGAELERSYRVPERRDGNLWSVCALDGDSIDSLDTMTHEAEPNKVGDGPLSALIPGDILMGSMPDNNIPTRWSHMGVYAGDGKVIEASDFGVPVKSYSIRDWEYPRMTYTSYFRVTSADDAIRRKAVEFVELQAAAEKGYDIGFHAKQLDGDSWYCSELVWAAYMNASDGTINLETSPDFLGVYPWEIEHNDETALVGGHYERLPPKNWFKMGAVGIKRLVQYVLVPAGGGLIATLMESLKSPQFVLMVFLGLGAAILLRDRIVSTGLGEYRLSPWI